MSVLGAAVGAPFLASAAVPAAAAAAAAPPAPKPATADIRFAYDTPTVAADGEHVIWGWTVTNAGPGAAGGVVVVHHLVPPLKITQMSKECRAIADGVSCAYGTIKAGQRRAGELTAELSPDVSGTLEINGRATWQQGIIGPDGAEQSTQLPAHQAGPPAQQAGQYPLPGAHMG